MLNEAPQCPRRESKFSPVHCMKVWGCMELELHSFVTSALGGDNWIPWKVLGRWLGRRAVLEVLEKRKIYLSCLESNHGVSVSSLSCCPHYSIPAFIFRGTLRNATKVSVMMPGLQA
jgi:hypothetical protein